MLVGIAGIFYYLIALIFFISLEMCQIRMLAMPEEYGSSNF